MIIQILKEFKLILKKSILDMFHFKVHNVLNMMVTFYPIKYIGFQFDLRENILKYVKNIKKMEKLNLSDQTNKSSKV